MYPTAWLQGFVAKEKSWDSASFLMVESPASVPTPESHFRTPLKFRFVCIDRAAASVNVIYIIIVADNSDFRCNGIWNCMVPLTEGFQSVLEQNI